MFLRSVEIPYVNITTCQSIEINSWTNITEDMICTGNLHNGGVSTCHGDSGGPLILNDGPATLVGITSWGYGCEAEANTTEISTRVTSYLDWIQETLEMIANENC